MANNITNLYFSNTFGDLVRTTSNIVTAFNYLGFQDWDKPSGKFTVSSSGDGFVANTNAVFRKDTRIEGIGSSLYIQNNTEIGKKLSLTDRANNETFYSNGISVFANGSNYISYLDGGYNIISLGNALFSNNINVLQTTNTSILNAKTIGTLNNDGSSSVNILYSNNATISQVFSAKTIGILNNDGSSSVNNLYSNNVSLLNATIKNLTVSGTQTIAGTPTFDSISFRLSANTPTWFPSIINTPTQIIVNRTYDANTNTWYSSNADASLSWSESSKRWRTVNVSASTSNTNPVYRNILTEDDINDNFISNSNTSVASARTLTITFTTANTANNTANFANTRATTANNTANFANTRATTANNTANFADTRATTANNTANFANTRANEAYTLANSSITVTGTGITVTGSPVKLGGTLNLAVTGVGGVASITGTNNQIIVTNTDSNNFIISTPQNTHSTAIPTFGGIKLNGIAYSNTRMIATGYYTPFSIAETTANVGSIEIRSADNNSSAAIGFNIPDLTGGQLYFGLEKTDKRFKIGGWSAGASAANVALWTDKLNSFASTTSAELRAVISDETGTGSLVFSTSPTLTGKPLTPTAGTGTSNTMIASTEFSANATNIITGILSGDRGVISGNTNSSFVKYTGTTKTDGSFYGGTTNPTGTTRLNYDGDFYANTIFGIITATNASYANTANYIVQRNSSGDISANTGFFTEIRSSGDVSAYNSSDIRLKENIETIKTPIEKLKQIGGYTFDWNDNYINSKGGVDNYFVRKHDIGVIAQEIETVLPELVVTKSDGYKAVKYEKIIALLIEAVKEQQTTIDELKSLIEK